MTDSNEPQLPENNKFNAAARGALQAVGGAIPYVGGLISAAAGAWSENEQEKVNNFLKYWVQMLKDEMKEKEATMLEIMARLNLQDEKISKRIESKEYQSLIKKTFREWSGAENEEKRKYIRNILSNAASTDLSSDDVVRLFIDWINLYSELHFKVIGAIYNSNGISRGQIWKKIGKAPVREDSADADLYKLMIRDLSTGGIIRQHRETDYYGNFQAKPRPKTTNRTSSHGKTLTSAFDNEDLYELTSLGQQFVHYAMNELAPRIQYNNSSRDDSYGKDQETI